MSTPSKSKNINAVVQDVIVFINDSAQFIASPAAESTTAGGGAAAAAAASPCSPTATFASVAEQQLHNCIEQISWLFTLASHRRAPSSVFYDKAATPTRPGSDSQQNKLSSNSSNNKSNTQQPIVQFSIVSGPESQSVQTSRSLYASLVRQFAGREDDVLQNLVGVSPTIIAHRSLGAAGGSGRRAASSGDGSNNSASRRKISLAEIDRAVRAAQSGQKTGDISIITDSSMFSNNDGDVSENTGGGDDRDDEKQPVAMKPCRVETVGIPVKRSEDVDAARARVTNFISTLEGSMDAARIQPVVPGPSSDSDSSCSSSSAGACSDYDEEEAGGVTPEVSRSFARMSTFSTRKVIFVVCNAFSYGIATAKCNRTRSNAQQQQNGGMFLQLWVRNRGQHRWHSPDLWTSTLDDELVLLKEAMSTPPPAAAVAAAAPPAAPPVGAAAPVARKKKQLPSLDFGDTTVAAAAVAIPEPTTAAIVTPPPPMPPSAMDCSVEFKTATPASVAPDSMTCDASLAFVEEEPQQQPVLAVVQEQEQQQRADDEPEPTPSQRRATSLATTASSFAIDDDSLDEEFSLGRDTPANRAVAPPPPLPASSAASSVPPVAAVPTPEALPTPEAMPLSAETQQQRPEEQQRDASESASSAPPSRSSSLRAALDFFDPASAPAPKAGVAVERGSRKPRFVQETPASPFTRGGGAAIPIVVDEEEDEARGSSAAPSTSRASSQSTVASLRPAAASAAAPLSARAVNTTSSAPVMRTAARSRSRSPSAGATKAAVSSGGPDLGPRRTGEQACMMLYKMASTASRRRSAREEQLLREKAEREAAELARLRRPHATLSMYNVGSKEAKRVKSKIVEALRADPNSDEGMQLVPNLPDAIPRERVRNMLSRLVPPGPAVSKRFENAYPSTSTSSSRGGAGAAASSSASTSRTASSRQATPRSATPPVWRPGGAAAPTVAASSRGATPRRYATPTGAVAEAARSSRTSSTNSARNRVNNNNSGDNANACRRTVRSPSPVHDRLYQNRNVTRDTNQQRQRLLDEREVQDIVDKRKVDNPHFLRMCVQDPEIEAQYKRRLMRARAEERRIAAERGKTVNADARFVVRV